ncbi:hypothetical protein [Neoroseomonas rubea]|uniref:hypothetical protein n=1 Tax=Neoroseomonas rubea TaxID=2748666 RepID=UPI0018DF3DF5|nr:hypothetical protein [Roseomonas rubea]
MPLKIVPASPYARAAQIVTEGKALHSAGNPLGAWEALHALVGTGRVENGKVVVALPDWLAAYLLVSADRLRAMGRGKHWRTRAPIGSQQAREQTARALGLVGDRTNRFADRQARLRAEQLAQRHIWALASGLTGAEALGRAAEMLGIHTSDDGGQRSVRRKIARRSKKPKVPN